MHKLRKISQNHWFTIIFYKTVPNFGVASPTWTCPVFFKFNLIQNSINQNNKFKINFNF